MDEWNCGKKERDKANELSRKKKEKKNLDIQKYLSSSNCRRRTK